MSQSGPAASSVRNLLLVRLESRLGAAVSGDQRPGARLRAGAASAARPAAADVPGRGWGCLAAAAVLRPPRTGTGRASLRPPRTSNRIAWQPTHQGNGISQITYWRRGRV